jgi:hypothetical protein
MAVMGGMRAVMARLIVGLGALGQLSDPEPADPGAHWAGGLEMFAARNEPPAPGPAAGRGSAARTERRSQGAARRRGAIRRR